MFLDPGSPGTTLTWHQNGEEFRDSGPLGRGPGSMVDKRSSVVTPLLHLRPQAHHPRPLPLSGPLPLHHRRIGRGYPCIVRPRRGFGRPGRSTSKQYNTHHWCCLARPFGAAPGPCVFVLLLTPSFFLPFFAVCRGVPPGLRVPTTPSPFFAQQRLPPPPTCVCVCACCTAA